MSSRITLTTHLRVSLIVACALACGTGKTVPVEHVVTEASLDSLPRATVSEGHQLCLATGWDSCPLGAAFANWLGETSFALWEPGRAVQVWRATDSIPLELGAKNRDVVGLDVIIAVAKRGRQFMVLYGPMELLVRYDESGRLLDATPMPRLAGSNVRGFVLGQAVMQRMRPTGPGGGALFELLRLRDVADTSGVVLLGTSLPWLRLNNGDPSLLPLFPPWPSFALDTQGGLAWTPGDRFLVHRVDEKGSAIWTVRGDFTGPAITAEDIARRRQELAMPTRIAPAAEAQLDSMVAVTKGNHPAISGVLLNQQQELLVVGPVTPSGDSVVIYHFAANGTPKERLILSKRTRLLLFSGDSILVQRPTEGEPWEVRWLRLSSKH